MPQERIQPLKIKTSSRRCSRTSATSTPSRSSAGISHTQTWLPVSWPGLRGPRLKPGCYLSSENLQTLLKLFAVREAGSLSHCRFVSGGRRDARGGFYTHASLRSQCRSSASQEGEPVLTSHAGGDRQAASLTKDSNPQTFSFLTTSRWTQTVIHQARLALV